ncbi:MAG: amidohydrolase family protein [Sphaerochaeta sp.]|jgi:predicted TIM-barrel fold metal-dependent hydrolase
MKFDFSNFSVVDCHAHPFMPSREKKEYGRRYIISSDRYMKVAQEDFSNTLAYRMILVELARLLELDPNIADDKIIKARNDLASQDYKKYVELLFNDANITTFLNETGFPIQGARLRPEETALFESATSNLDVREILRLEMICNHIVADNIDRLNFKEFLQKFREEISSRVSNNIVVAFKTVIGYFSGLEITPHAELESEQSFNEYYYGRNEEKSMAEFRAIQKPFRDYMVFECVRLCRQYDLPLQIHTGAGDPPSCDLRLMRPSLLYDFLNRQDTGSIHIALLHGGYPFSEEMAFMVNSYANVVTDVSSITADASIAVERVLPILLEKVPLTKIMYGSDGAGDVDPIWFAAINFKRVLARLFENFVERNIFTKNYGEHAAKLILSENAKRFYRL